MCSRLLAGSEALVNGLKETVDGQNTSFFDAAKSAGYVLSQENLSTVILEKGSYFAFLELHIEQGPLLEEEGWPQHLYVSFVMIIFNFLFQS